MKLISSQTKSPMKINTKKSFLMILIGLMVQSRIIQLMVVRNVAKKLKLSIILRKREISMQRLTWRIMYIHMMEVSFNSSNL